MTADVSARDAELLALGTATLYEAARSECFLPTRLRPAWPGAAVVGRALPVRTPGGDNLALHRSLEHARQGEVLVVDADAAPFGHWGEVLTVAARQRGVRGLVIDGGVRDVDRLAALGFPVFSSSVALGTTVKRSPGTVGERLVLGGVPVDRGDTVVADIDGVVVVPRSRLEEVLAAARRRAEAELAYLDRIRAGELTLDLYRLR